MAVGALMAVDDDALFRQPALAGAEAGNERTWRFLTALERAALAVMHPGRVDVIGGGGTGTFAIAREAVTTISSAASNVCRRRLEVVVPSG